MIRRLGWALWTAVNGFAFCIFAWTAGNVPPPPTSILFPLPGWVWTYSMGLAAIALLIGSIGGALKCVMTERR